MTQQWTKAELEDWCRGWCRTPITTLKAFIDAGFCSDEAPLREEMRLLRQPTPSTVDATKPVMSYDVLRAIRHLLKYSNPIGVIGDMWRDHALKLLQRPEAPTDGRCVWYRGWECCPDGHGMAGQIGGWHACLGGADADCISVDALTWGELLDEIDEHDMTEAARAALTEPTDG